jgi:tetratricopeptide (TPR) repeat protein
MFHFLLRLRPSHLRWLFAGLGLTLLAGAIWILPRFRAQENPLLTSPRFAVEALTPGPLYYNAAARPALLALRPELLEAEDRDERSERSRALVQAVVNPKLFRQLDRRYHFATLLLVGDPSQFRTLLEHLQETKDFRLSYVDHTSVIFRRSAEELWTTAALEPIRAKFASASKRDRAKFLALTGTKLTAAHFAAEGRALLEEALSLDGGLADAWSGLALDHMNRGRWADALANADRALAIDRNHLAALSTKTQVLYANKRFNEAYQLSTRLAAQLPEDPHVLFKHAQIAHEARAFTTEIVALEQLIQLATKNERPVTGYRLYLAQAYMAAGKGQPAIDNFQLVMADPHLPADQRTFAKDSIERIKTRLGL